MPEHHAKMFDVVFQHARQGMALVGLDGRFVTVNEALAGMLGVPAQDLPGQSFQQFTHPDDVSADQVALTDLREGVRHDYAVVKRYLPRTGGVIWVDVYVAAVTDAEGRPAFFVTQARDVTQERAQTEQVRTLSEQLNVAVQATEDGVWNWRVGEPAVQVTDRWTALMAHDPTARTVTLRWWWRHLHPDDRPAVRAQVREHLTGTRPKLDAVHRVLRPDGHWAWRALRGRVVSRDAAGRPARLAGTLSDMEERMQTQQDLQVLLDHLPGVVGYWDANLHNRFGNQRYFDWYGKRPDVLRGRHISEVIGEDTYQRNRPFIERVLRGEPQSFERRHTTADGRVMDTHVQYIPDTRGRTVRGFYVLGTDITTFRRTQQDLEEQRELARITLDSIGDGVITTNPDGRVTFMNPVAQRLTGWRIEEALGRTVETVLPLVDPRQNRAVLNPLRVALRDRTVVGLSSEATVRSRLGAVSHIEDSAAPIFGPSGDLLGGVIVFHDVTEKQQLARRMSHLARHDHLTGLPNRTTLLEHLSGAVAQAARTEQSFAVMFVDLDEFKQVNDTLGHALGDELLRQVAARLQQEVRGSDVIARQGGDEFLILLPEPLTAPEVQAVGERLLRTLTRPFQLDDHSVTITSSVGVAIYPQDGGDAEELIRHADAAMYRAKADGRNCLRFFDAPLNEQLRDQQSLTAALKLAVQGEQLHLAYQPQVNARTGGLVGVEALLRWTMPDGRVVSPGVFVPLAERSGVMMPLGTWVLREAVRQARQWEQAGQPVRVAVNVSAVQFAAPGFARTVRDVLAASGLAPHLLELEVTESLLLHDVSRVGQMLADLKGLGVHLSLDDFGTGYSSLSYLQAFPIDTLKIDRSFMPTPEKPVHTVLSAVIGLGQALGLHVIAEGVETQEQQDLLLDLGCERAQGYLHARPMSAQQVDAWRRDRPVRH
ncbi:sensor domain-containing protein [Deinococcus sedimenti]|uniref:EAL domain-containing protein n=1 Tax=Deinococcus sedimenti TaxID=1867090 RepID=A0ABQ2S9W9_9DEIO|nr:EAL domain-containing protein [Deinococcus sedimenti]GGS10073.1 hypothetical protein GCM10008960_40330 [Deinococcus sedimenti]